MTSAGEVRSTTNGRFALGLAFAWAALFAFYLLFAGSLGLNEVLAGAVSAALGCLWWTSVGRRGGLRFAGWERELLPLVRAIVGLPTAMARVGAQLARAIVRGGSPGSVSYRRDADNAWASADSPAERAFGLIGASLAPDRFVLREKGGDAGIVEHSLSPAKPGQGNPMS